MRSRSVSAVLALVLAAGCASSVSHTAAEGALGPYSASVEAAGFVFVSGKIGDRSGSFALEAETSLDGVARELERQGLDFADVVTVTVYLTDMERYGEFNEIYAARLTAPYPARACVAVAALPAGARVEVQVVARR